MHWSIEFYVGDRLFLVGEMNLRNRLAGLVLGGHPDAAVERTAIGIDADCSVDSGDFGLWSIFVLLELAFVVCLNVAARLGIKVFVQNVRVVVVPGAGANRDD